MCVVIGVMSHIALSFCSRCSHCEDQVPDGPHEAEQEGVQQCLPAVQLTQCGVCSALDLTCGVRTVCLHTCRTRIVCAL